MQARWGLPLSPPPCGKRGGGKNPKPTPPNNKQLLKSREAQARRLPSPGAQSQPMSLRLPSPGLRPPSPPDSGERSRAPPSRADPRRGAKLGRDRLNDTGGAKVGAPRGAAPTQALAPPPSPGRALIGRARPRAPAAVGQRTFPARRPRPSAERRVPPLARRLRQPPAPPPVFPPASLLPDLVCKHSRPPLPLPPDPRGRAGAGLPRGKGRR